MKIIVILFTLLFFNQNIFCQLFEKPLYVPGKIVVDTDTTNCFLKYQDSFYGTIKYKMSQDDKQPLEIDESEVDHIYLPPKTYDRVANNRSSALMERICIGKVSLYKHIRYRTMTTGTGTMSTYSEEVLYVVKNGYPVELKRKNFKETLKTAMPEYEELSAKIDELKFGDLSYDYQLRGIIADYNFRKSHPK